MLSWSIRSPRSANVSESGFLPVRLVYASIACTIASTPVIAVTDGGSPSVRVLSSTATSGYSSGETTPTFSLSGVVTIAIGVTSEPVPAVVGTATSGRRGPSASPIP